MDVIDSHIHFWDIKNGYNEWVKTTKLPKLVIPNNLSTNSFVHIEAHGERLDPLCEYFWLKLNFPDKNIKVVAFVDFSLEISKFEKIIIKLAEYNDIAGIRQIMSQTYKSKYSPFDKSIPRDLETKLKLLKDYSLLFEAQMYPEQFLPLLDKINNSGVDMVIEHFGLPLFGRNNNLVEWYTFIKQCAENNKWNLKLSGFDLNNDISYVNRALDFVFENIKSNQLCYGSNFPVSHKSKYNQWQNFLHQYIGNDKISKDIFKNVAQRIYFKNQEM